MPVLFTSALLLAVIVYSAAISHVEWLNMVPYVPAIRSFVAGRMLIVHGAAVFAALCAGTISALTIFRIREHDMVVGNKRVLVAICLLSLVMIGVLLYQVRDAIQVFIEGILSRPS